MDPNPTPPFHAAAAIPALGLGIGWRPELAHLIARREDLGFVEIIAENETPGRLSPPLHDLRERGVAIIPHGVGLSLGGAELPDPRRIERLARLAEETRAPFVSEHIAFVRAGEREAGHLLPLPHTETQLEILCENVERVARALPVPLALENISALFAWPEADMTEARFITRLLEQTGTLLLLDVANVHANARNLRRPALEFLRELPMHRLAYVHVGGGHDSEEEGVYHDTHGDPVPPEVFALLDAVARRWPLPALMLERDSNYPDPAEIHRELDALSAALALSHSAPPSP